MPTPMSARPPTSSNRGLVGLGSGPWLELFFLGFDAGAGVGSVGELGRGDRFADVTESLQGANDLLCLTRPDNA